MVYLEIENHPKSAKNIATLNKYLTNPRASAFILFYMEGCGPCNETRPEWAKLKNVMPHSNDDDVVIVAIDQTLFSKLKNAGNEPTGFPTMRYIANKGKINENYEDSSIPTKDRSIDSFVEWIHGHRHKHGLKSDRERTGRRMSGGRKRRHTKRRRSFTRRRSRSNTSSIRTRRYLQSGI